MTFEQLDRSIDADSDSDDELAQQQHMYKGREPLTDNYWAVSNIELVMSGKGKEQDTANQLAGLHISGKSPSPETRPPPPPRPVRQPPEEEEDEDDFEEEDENDPFADRNAVTTPKVERSEPVWYVIFQVQSNHDNQRRNIGELFDSFLLR